MKFTDEDYEAIIHHSNSSYIREMVELLARISHDRINKNG